MAQEETVYIKQLLLSEDIKWGTERESQVRSGITVTGEQVSTAVIPVFSNHSGFTNMQLTDLLDKLIQATGITPDSPGA